jgi:glyoxylase-like metal-dependent hydrolase (beta-lactamase superfamily II)
VAVVDPGPPLEDHVEELVRALASARHVTLLPTHGHPDHAGAVESLLAALVRARGGRTGVEARGWGTPTAGPLREGDVIHTDAGDLVAFVTPGHTRDHTVFHWPGRNALFAGDVLLGEGDTTWVAEYPGCVADYLASLERLRGVPLSVIYPAHGPPIDDPAGALNRYESHRRTRIARVREALERRPGAAAGELMDLVYGDTVPPGMEGAALESLRAVLEYVEAHPGG